MLTIKDKDGKEYNLSEDDLLKNADEAIQEYKDIIRFLCESDHFADRQRKEEMLKNPEKYFGPFSESVFVDFITTTLRRNYSYNLTQAAGKLVSNYASEHGYIFQEPFVSVSVENMLEYFSLSSKKVWFDENVMPIIIVPENFDFETANKMGWRKIKDFQIEPYLICDIEKQYLPDRLYAKLDKPKFKNNVDDFIESPIKVYMEMPKQNDTNIVCFDTKKNLIADRYIYNPEEKQMYLYGGIHHRSIIKSE